MQIAVCRNFQRNSNRLIIRKQNNCTVLCFQSLLMILQTVKVSNCENHFTHIAFTTLSESFLLTGFTISDSELEGVRAQNLLSILIQESLSTCIILCLLTKVKTDGKHHYTQCTCINDCNPAKHLTQIKDLSMKYQNIQRSLTRILLLRTMFLILAIRSEKLTLLSAAVTTLSLTGVFVRPL